MRTALMTENNGVDGQVILHLARLCGRSVVHWDPARQFFGGWKQVVRSAHTYLRLAGGAGVQRAIVTIDNDGTPTRRPPHAPAHQHPIDGAELEDGCATCVVLNNVPPEWGHAPFFHCIAVPVQTLETWLLIASGFQFTNPVPEKNYHRAPLKRAFYGGKKTSAEKLAYAREVLTAPALASLRTRPSFVDFERQLSNWPLI